MCYFRRDFNVAQYNITMQQFAATNRQVEVAQNSPEPRAEIIEEHLWRHGGPTFKKVQPKSYKILDDVILFGGLAVWRSHICAPPPSVFERNMEERSPYLQATEPSIQKAYGQS
ncbi:hypothetical protein AHF37_11120 [Paragonimus kellicotti]|nr:hypothetical protein AHF37_11120 [Paragonimus kellicotti]